MTEERKRRLTAMVALSLRDELGRVPEVDEVDTYAKMARVLFKAILGTHYSRIEQKSSNQMRLY